MDPHALARIERLNYVITAIVIAIGAVALGRPYALGLGVGALIASVNFTLIRRLVERQMKARSAPGGRGSRAAFLFLPKMIALFAVIFVCVRYLPLSAVALAIGFSTFFVSILIETVRFALKGSAEPNGESHTR